MKRGRNRWAALGAAMWLAGPAGAADEEGLLGLEELFATVGQSFETAEVRTETLDEGLHVVFGMGGNIAASIGPEGTLVVDDQFPELLPRIEAALRGLGSRGIDFAINTHWHFDHAQGNLVLGPAGTRIVSHARSREMMQRTNLVDLVVAKYRQEAYPDEALPVVVFEDRMQMYWNGERVDLIHAGPAHTTGDVAVFFRGRKAVHMGDVFNNTGYPFIDAGNGGSIDGMIAFCRAILGELPPDAAVIPGHGPVADVAALRRYVGMLQTVRDRVAVGIDEGKSLEEIEAARPTADFDATYGDVAKSMGFVNRVYTSLAAER